MSLPWVHSRFKSSLKAPQSTSSSQLGHVFLDDEHQITMPLAFGEFNAVLPLLALPELLILAEPPVFEGQLSGPAYNPSGFTSTLPDGMGLPVGNLSQGKFAICTASLSNAYRV
jgi:hypothetical protein